MTVQSRERLARVALNQLAEPGDPRLLSLVRRMGAEEVYEALRAERDLEGALSDVAARLAGIDPARTLEQAERIGARFVVPGDAEWPAGLDALADIAPLHQRGGVPVGLWVRGPVTLDTLGPSVAVVGSRAATTYGAHVARELAGEVAQQQWGVVSGAAFGIDQAAHRAALAVDGTTVAVLACGIDRAYPAAHRELIAAIRERGAVVSEAPLGAAPMRVRFLARNRLIAGLTRGAVVVEAAVRSGALSTATWADRLHRPVMGVPGPVSSGLSQGVHHLIRSGGASLVTTGAEVLEMLAESGHWLAPVPRGLASPRDVLSVRQRQLLDAVPVATGRPLSAIARAAGLAESMARREMQVLRDQGFVAPAGDGWRLGVAAR